MSDFGDFTNDDAYDHEPPEPEQVAYRLFKLVHEVNELRGGDVISWDDLTPTEQSRIIYLAQAFVAWAQSKSHPEPYEAARMLHEISRTRTGAPSWDDLNGDERALAIDLMKLIIDWLEREGALA